MNIILKNRIKSFLWRGGSLAAVAVCGYILKVGDIWKLDFHLLANLAVVAIAGLVLAEVTKYLNTNE